MKAKKKQQKSRKVAPKYARMISSAVLAALILVVGFLVMKSGAEKPIIGVSAPLGTISRSTEINTAEITQETASDAAYTNGQMQVVQSDDNALLQVDEAIPDGSN